MAIWALSCFPCGASAQIEQISVRGTQFQVETTDGTVLTSQDLIGATLTLADGTRIRIEEVAADPSDKTGDVWLHRILLARSDGSWDDFCRPDPEGKQLAFPLAGHMNSDGSIVEKPGSIQIVCTSGAQGKCIRFGYKPWLDDRGGKPMLDYYNACIRMVRADYCGDGTATTNDGTWINLYDDIGIQVSEPLEGMQFEAGWSTYGATCISRVRIPDNTSLDELIKSCPRLQDVPLRENCTESRARSDNDTLLFNSSFPK